MINKFLRKRNASLIENGYTVSLLLISLTIFSPKLLLLNISIFLLILVWLYEGNFKLKLERLRKTPIALFYILFFFLYLIGAFYTDNLNDGVKSLETKASLLVFPVVIGSSNLKRDIYRKAILFFAISCVTCSLIALVYQVNVAMQKNDFNYLISDGLVYIMQKQAVYYSMYVSFSILILLHFIWESYNRLVPWKKVLTIASIVFLFLILFLLSSRASILILLFIFVTTLVMFGIKQRKFKLTATILFLLIGLFAGLSFIFPQIISRFQSLNNLEIDYTNRNDIYHFSDDVEENPKSWNGINLRLAKWICALEVIKENPVVGVGTGDVKNELVEVYKEKNFYLAIERRFDPHNQFLDTTVAIGLIGLVVLCFCFFYPLYYGIKRRDWLLSSFMLLILVCSLTESLLSSSHGIIFFCFFLFLLYKTSLPLPEPIKAGALDTRMA